MKDKKLYDLMNERMTSEMGAFYFYFDLETQALNKNYNGFAKALHAIGKKHLKNSVKYRDIVISLKGLPIPKPLDAAREKKFTTIQEVAKAALRKEKEITRGVNETLWYAWDSKEWVAINFLKDEFEKQTKLQNKVEDIEIKWTRAKDEVYLDERLGQEF